MFAFALGLIFSFVFPIACLYAHIRRKQRDAEEAARQHAEEQRRQQIRRAEEQRKKREQAQQAAAIKSGELSALRAELAAANAEIAALQRAFAEASAPSAPSQTITPEAPAARLSASSAPQQAAAAPEKPAPALSQTFRGHRVAFTGKLPNMTRQQAIEKVIERGGRAYTGMPAGTTLLVVGDKPGMRKIDQADEWIGQVRKITARQFFDMLAAA